MNTSVNLSESDAALQSGKAEGMAAIKRKSLRGGVTTLAAQAGSAGLQLTSTIVLARILGPGEYGIVAMVQAVTGFAGLFRDLGLSSSTIQRDKLSHAQLSSLFWINVAMGTSLTVIVAAISPGVAWFYGRPELIAVTITLACTFVIGSFGTQHGALLTRQMRFGRKAIATLSGASVNLILAISLAWHGHGYWSLVFGSLGGALVTTLLLFALSGWRPGPPARSAGVGSMLRYGANITGFDLVNYFSRNLDNVLIGRFWGADALGLYSRAYQLLMFPITNLRGPIQAVAFPAMSQLQNQSDNFRTYYRRTTAMLAFTSMPLTCFFFVAATPIIQLALGTDWLKVVPIFSVLAIVSFIQPCYGLIGLVMLSSGRAQRYLHTGIFNAAVYVTGFIIGVHWGPLGVATAYACSTYLLVYPTLKWTFSDSPIRVSDFFLAIRLPASASILSGIATFLCQRLLGSFSPIGQLISLGLIFAAIYIGTYALVPKGREWLQYCIKSVFAAIGRNYNLATDPKINSRTSFTN